MIKDIIFDLGNTVLKFDPYDITRIFYKEEKDIDLLVSVTFSRKHWDPIDRGALSQEDLKKEVRAELPPHLWSYSDTICDEWPETLPVITGMEELIDDLRAEGYGLYVLSNISKNFSNKRDKIHILKKFDDLILSADFGMVKPEAEIFNLALSKFKLNASEALFIDDMPANIEGAEKAGIQGYLFDGNAHKLRQFIFNQ